VSTSAQQLVAGRYRLQRDVGGGGMGAVWEAFDEQLDRRVAIKIPDPRLSAEPSFVERFRREARSAARLSHPNTAQVYDYGVDGGQPYLVMEFVPGETLASRLAREGTLPSDEARRIAAGTADALHAAHEAGVVHRDVKPGNIMIAPGGGVKVLDFGIAAAATDGRMTGSGQVLGTPTYIAPEQASGKGATPASDVYALGVVLYEMLAGHPPFEGDTAVAVATAHLHRDPEPLEGVAPRADPDLVAACRSAMAKDPGERPGTAAEFAELLRGRPPGSTDTSTAMLKAPAAPTEVISSSRTEQLEATGTAVLPAAASDTAEGPATPPPARRPRRGIAGWVVAVAVLVLVGVLLIVLAATLSPQAPAPPAPPSTPAATAPTPNPTTPSPSPSSSPSETTTTTPPSPSPSGTGSVGLPTPSLSVGV
jgi:eukaryotic-like serine/threonine-protein kinase